MTTIRVLYCALGDDYGDPTRGPSFERENFEKTLRHMDVELIHHDFARELIEHGYWRANERLLELARTAKPDYMFAIMFEEQMDRDVVTRITREMPVKTLGWFCDDHWRFDRFSRHWANAFDWVVTTDDTALEKYRAVGQPNVLLSQWAVNHFDYRPVEADKRFDVTFVGQPHSDRRAAVDFLRRNGIDVRTWGHGWPEGRVTQSQLIEIICSSKVNLNFSASSTRTSLLAPRLRQIKGRAFEIPGCGGLLLTEEAPGLERFYEIGAEVMAFRGHRDLLRAVRWLLEDDERREAIARAGMARTLRDHTYERRLNDIVAVVGAWEKTGSTSASGRV